MGRFWDMRLKFPQTFTIGFLLRYHISPETKRQNSKPCFSLDKMAQGGLYDHLGGGFARYSTDREWLAPHFEKMLYDNALLVAEPVRGVSAHREQHRYKEVVEETLHL